MATSEADSCLLGRCILTCYRGQLTVSGEKETWTADERGGFVALGWLGAFAQAALIVGWLFAVHETDPWFSGSYYACYAFVGGLALMALADNQCFRKVNCRDVPSFFRSGGFRRVSPIRTRHCRTMVLLASCRLPGRDFFRRS